jgi:hypothetical protein
MIFRWHDEWALLVKVKVQGELPEKLRKVADYLCTERARACWVQGLDQQIWIRPARIRSRGVAGDMNPTARWRSYLERRRPRELALRRYCVA